MSALPYITVIIPFYNHHRFVQKRLESIIAQTAGNLQLIILDDASTDGTSELLNEWKSHPQVKQVIVNEENGGSPFLQWHKGLSLVDTEWVWIAEGDDYCAPGFIEALLPAFENPGCVLAYNEIEWVDETGNILKPGHSAKKQWFKGKEYLKSHMFHQDHLVNAGMVLFRKSAADRVDPAWLNMRQAGDYWFWCEIARQGMVYASGRVLASFVRHNKSLSFGQLTKEWNLHEILLVQDRLCDIGAANKNDLRDYLVRQLVQLETNRKGMDRNYFYSKRNFWMDAAVKREINISAAELSLRSYFAKAMHILR